MLSHFKKFCSNGLSQKKISMDNVAIIIVSCDAYQDTWPYFFSCFDMFWRDCSINKYLITNELTPTYPRTLIISTGLEKSWSAKMKYALNKIPEDNILLMLDDYFLWKKVNNSDIEHKISEFISFGYDYLRLMPIPKVSQGPRGIYELNGKNLYEINLQAALWKKSYLMQVLREDGLSAWQVEAKQKVSSPDRIFGKCMGVNYPILDYLNGVIQGKWYPETINKLKKLGIEIDTSNRGLMSSKDIMQRNFKNFVMHNVSIKTAMKIKKVLKAFGVKFVTEN